jgi:hypothetical protein
MHRPWVEISPRHDASWTAGRIAPTSPKRRAHAFELARHRGALSHRHAPSMFPSVQTTPRHEAHEQPHELSLRCSRACSWCLNTGMEENSPHNDVALRWSVATCRSLSTTPSLPSSPTPRTAPPQRGRSGGGGRHLGATTLHCGRTLVTVFLVDYGDST